MRLLGIKMSKEGQRGVLVDEDQMNSLSQRPSLCGKFLCKVMSKEGTHHIEG